MGFIGLGNMGLPMTGNLVKKGYQVKAFDISPQSLEKCHEYGVKPVQSIAEVAQDVRFVALIYISSQVDFIVTSVPATKDVEEVLQGPDGIFAHAKKGTYIVDTSTISPIASKEFAAEAKKKEMVFIDSPMSGGITGA